jgi:hypothetical protein
LGAQQLLQKISPPVQVEHDDMNVLSPTEQNRRYLH